MSGKWHYVLVTACSVEVRSGGEVWEMRSGGEVWRSGVEGGDSSLEAVGEGGVLFNVQRKVQEIFIFAANCLTAQTTCLICECSLEYIMDPCWLRRLALSLLLGCRRGTRDCSW